MLQILILEDDPQRTKLMLQKLADKGAVKVVQTAKEAIGWLEIKDWNLLSLDHDLGGEEMVESGPGTGYEVACWLEEHPDRQPGVIWLHSLNPVGRYKMSEALPNAQEKPFWWKEGE